MIYPCWDHFPHRPSIHHRLGDSRFVKLPGKHLAQNHRTAARGSRPWCPAAFKNVQFCILAIYIYIYMICIYHPSLNSCSFAFRFIFFSSCWDHVLEFIAGIQRGRNYHTTWSIASEHHPFINPEYCFKDVHQKWSFSQGSDFIGISHFTLLLLPSGKLT